MYHCKYLWACYEIKLVCSISHETAWRHQMETFSALLAFCEGNQPVTGGLPSQRTVTQSFNLFSLICVWRNGWAIETQWLETPSRSALWRHCNGADGLLCFVLFWLYPQFRVVACYLCSSRLLHWYCGNHVIAQIPLTHWDRDKMTTISEKTFSI